MDEIERLKKQNRELQLKVSELELQVEKLTRMRNQALAVIFITAIFIFISANA